MCVCIYIYMFGQVPRTSAKAGPFKVRAAVAIVALTVATMASCAAVAAIMAHRVPPKCDDDWSQGSSLKSTACAFAVLLDSL